MITIQAYPDGIDCTWLGMDQRGTVAAFVTSGEGEIPTALLMQANIDLRNIETLLMDLPVTGDVKLRASVARPDDFLDMACRGLYVYDWNGSKYVLVAEPEIAIQISDLDDELKDIAKHAVFDSIEFPKWDAISVGSMMEAVQPGM
ncbi:hypothetical protein [Stenotrophomonas sp.]|uniref:hypothetical protein n=1 Tax=Stenotrophomonas sp. TaxID=69392 RepID=UPI0028A81074|nr:hypothetical protein [Stenotrophomonas sp.]